MAVALVFVSGAAGFLAYRHMAPAPASIAALPTSTAVAPAPTAPDPAAPAAGAASTASPIPEEVPDLSLPDMSGKAYALRHNGGRPRLYNFWATWCEPCRREIPLLNTLQASYGRSDRLEIVGIAVDFQDAVTKFVAKTSLHYTSLVGEEQGLEAAQRFGMELALPFTVFADEQNRIIAVKVGELHRDEADLILGQLRALRTGATTLPAARALIAESLKTFSLKRAKQSAAS
jgi:thiol-disulfide isomerase/thioredoxin